MSNSVKFVAGEGWEEKPNYAFIGEAPGAKEDEEGRPFVGRSGKKLTKWIKDYLFLDRDEVYVTNIVKVRPENNRAPTDEEIYSWKPLLEAEINDVNPLLVFAVGTSASKALVPGFTIMSQDHGKFFYNDELDCYVVPVYHPAYVGRKTEEELKIKDAFINAKSYVEDWYRGRE